MNSDNYLASSSCVDYYASLYMKYNDYTMAQFINTIRLLLNVMSSVCSTGQESCYHSTALPAPVNNFEASFHESKIVVVVRSEKRIVDAKTICYPVGAIIGSYKVFKRVYVSDYVLDEKQQGIVDEARAVANHLGLRVEVRDLGRIGLLSRFLGAVSRSKIRVPSVTFPGWALSLIQDGVFSEHNQGPFRFAKSGTSSMENSSKKIETSKRYPIV